MERVIAARVRKVKLSVSNVEKSYKSLKSE